MKKNCYNKMSDLFTKEIHLGKFQTFLKHMKSAASKQRNMATMCQEHQNKGKPYILTHDPKFVNLFDIWNEELTIQYHAV